MTCSTVFTGVAGTPRLLEQLQQRLAIVRGDRVADDLLEVLAMAYAAEVRREALVAQRGEVERRDQPLPEAVVGAGDEHPLPVAAAEGAVGRERRVGRAERLRDVPGEEKPSAW